MLWTSHAYGRWPSVGCQTLLSLPSALWNVHGARGTGHSGPDGALAVAGGGTDGVAFAVGSLQNAVKLDAGAADVDAFASVQGTDPMGHRRRMQEHVVKDGDDIVVHLLGEPPILWEFTYSTAVRASASMSVSTAVRRILGLPFAYAYCAVRHNVRITPQAGGTIAANPDLELN